ncbi:hypothetical protein ACRAVF_20260 [Bradyrhizobium oligotrophicum S58]
MPDRHCERIVIQVSLHAAMTVRSPPLAGRAIAYGDGSFAFICFHIVMAGLVPAIHVVRQPVNGVDARDKPGHDGITNWQG